MCACQGTAQGDVQRDVTANPFERLITVRTVNYPEGILGNVPAEHSTEGTRTWATGPVGLRRALAEHRNAEFIAENQWQGTGQGTAPAEGLGFAVNVSFVRAPALNILHGTRTCAGSTGIQGPVYGTHSRPARPPLRRGLK
jgi:hypothetical protein